MKNWVMTIFALAGRVEGLCDRVEEEIDALSCNLTMDTYKLFDAVLALSDKRTRLINFKVIGNLMRENLSDAEADIIIRRGRGETFEEIGGSKGFSQSTAARRFARAVAKCALVAGNLAFTKERLEREYKDIPLIFKTVRKLGRTDK